MAAVRLRLFFPLLLLSLGCSALTRAVPQAATATPSPPPTNTAPPTPTPTPTPGPPAFVPPQCGDVALATIPAATVLAQPTPGLAAPSLTTEEQLAVFDDLAMTIEERYLYPDFNGVDWPGLQGLARAEIVAGMDTEAFYREMDNFIQALNDEHSHFESPVEVAASEAELAGTSEFVGIGVLVLPLPEKARLTILAVFPDSAAAHAGLLPHDSILAVDGLPVVEGDRAFPERVRGPECSALVLTAQSPGEPPRQIQLMRQRFTGGTPIVARLVPAGDGGRIGYIFLPTFFDNTIPEQVRQALLEFGDLDGLILDNRANGGGSSHVVEAILGFFTSGTLGHFVSREAERPLVIRADPVANSQEVPLVVLVGEDTVSFGEIFSGVLQDTGRARIVGQTTLGNVETLHGYDLGDGSTAWLAAEGFRPLRSGADWETTGVVPSVEVIADWDSFTFETDPGIAAALALLGH